MRKNDRVESKNDNEINSQGKRGRRNNPATQRHLGSQIKTLQDAPRDADKLERLLQVKRRQKEKSAILYPCLSFIDIEKRTK
jgi:hypothetical protein